MHPVLSVRRVVDRLQEGGYKAKVFSRDGRAWIESGAHGLNFEVIFYAGEDLEQPDACKSMAFDLTLGPYRKRNIDLLSNVCNEFCRKMRYVKAFVINREHDMLVSIQMDTLASGGVSDIFIDDAINAFVWFMADFSKLLRDAIDRTHDYSSYHTAALDAIWGVEKNPERAFFLYSTAAYGGFAGSQNNLGDMYETGLGCVESEVVAMHWYTRSAERGEPTAYFSISTLLLETKNATPDILITAAQFAILALERLPDGKNKASAQETLAKISEHLSEDQISHARALAEGWKPLFQETGLMGDSPDDGSFFKSTEKIIH